MSIAKLKNRNPLHGAACKKAPGRHYSSSPVYDKFEKMRVEIEIETLDRQLAFDLMGAPLRVGDVKDIPGGATLTCGISLSRKTVDLPEIEHLVLTLGAEVAVALVAHWLYDKLRGRATKLRIDQREVEIEAGAIKRIIETTIQVDE